MAGGRDPGALPGLIQPIRPALARPAGPIAAAGDIDALVAELRIAARAAADFCAFACFNMDVRIGGEAYPNAPITVNLTLPTSATGKTLYVYNHYCSYSGWRFYYSGVYAGASLILTAR